MSAYKVVKRNILSKRKVNKRVYINKEDFDKYSPELIERYSQQAIAEVWSYIGDNTWSLEKSFPPKCEMKCEGCYWFNKNSNDCGA